MTPKYAVDSNNNDTLGNVANSVNVVVIWTAADDVAVAAAAAASFWGGSLFSNLFLEFDVVSVNVVVVVYFYCLIMFKNNLLLRLGVTLFIFSLSCLQF